MYLSGAVRDVQDGRLGWMASPDIGSVIPTGAVWAYDNACFAHPGEFNWDRWYRVLQRRLRESPNCLFVVAPDVPFDADGTIQRFAQYRERLLELGLPIAFCLQDGMGAEDVPWADIDAVFVGGSTAWKTGHEAGAIISVARERRKWVHMGRVNSLRRLRVAASMGCDSVDGTFLKYAPDTNWPRLRGWLDALAVQPPMRLEHVA